MIANGSKVGEVNVSRETLERLEAYSSLILKWTKAINLIAPQTATDLWERHIKDSMQIYELAPKTWDLWLDLGSGGGLPGLVIAILDPQRQDVVLVESDQRKCHFLNTVRRELDLNVRVLNERIEGLDLPRADALSARALAPLPKLLEYASDRLAPDGTAYFPKGAKFQDELDEANMVWEFDVTPHVSQTNPTARILETSRIRLRET